MLEGGILLNKNILAIGIILLLIGVSVLPIISGNNVKINNKFEIFNNKKEVFLDGPYSTENGLIWKKNMDEVDDGIIKSFDDNIKPGWPVELDNHHGSGWAFDSSITCADLDQNGDLEVLIHSGEGKTNGKLYVFHYDGSPMDGWPIYTGSQGISTPAVGDIDPEYPGLEVVVAMNGLYSYWFVYAWHCDGTPVAGWPIEAGQSFCSPSIADIDNDGLLEIIQFIDNPCGDEWRDCKLYVWNGDGTNVSGFPIIFKSPPNFYFHGTSTAIGDIDNDDNLEIVFGLTNKSFYVIKNNGVIYDGWPISINTSEEHTSEPSPVLGDIDGDNDLEIVYTSTGNTDNIHVWHHDGSYMDGWPITVSWISDQSPSLCNVDNSSDLEIVMNYGYGSHTHDEIAIWNHNGSLLNGWPQFTTSSAHASPIVGDIDGDSKIEIFFCGYGGVYGWHHDGIFLENFPKIDLGRFDGTPALVDLENNGKMDLIAGPYAWEFTDEYGPLIVEWPMYQNNPHHTGCYNHAPNPPIIDGSISGKAGTPYTYTFTSTDPDGDDVSYYIKWGDGSVTDWTAFQASGPPGYSESHTWDEGTWTIKAKAKDIHGAMSDWAELKVTMPRTRAMTNLLLLRFLEQFPILQKILGYIF